MGYIVKKNILYSWCRTELRTLSIGFPIYCRSVCIVVIKATGSFIFLLDVCHFKEPMGLREAKIPVGLMILLGMYKYIAV